MRIYIHSFNNEINSFFPELGNSFKKWEEYFLKFVCYSQCNGYRHNIRLHSNCIINIFYITFRSLDSFCFVEKITQALICSFLTAVLKILPLWLISSCVTLLKVMFRTDAS